MYMNLDQFAIPMLGAAAIWLSQDARPKVARWACVCGLVAQPFWIYATWHASQWGILASCALYTWGWWRGVLRYWIRPQQNFCSNCGVQIKVRDGVIIGHRCPRG